MEYQALTITTANLETSTFVPFVENLVIVNHYSTQYDACWSEMVNVSQAVEQANRLRSAKHEPSIALANVSKELVGAYYHAIDEHQY